MALAHQNTLSPYNCNLTFTDSTNIPSVVLRQSEILNIAANNKKRYHNMALRPGGYLLPKEEA